MADRANLKPVATNVLEQLRDAIAAGSLKPPIDRAALVAFGVRHQIEAIELALAAHKTAACLSVQATYAGARLDGPRGPRGYGSRHGGRFARALRARPRERDPRRLQLRPRDLARKDPKYPEQRGDARDDEHDRTRDDDSRAQRRNVGRSRRLCAPRAHQRRAGVLLVTSRTFFLRVFGRERGRFGHLVDELANDFFDRCGRQQRQYRVSDPKSTARVPRRVLFRIEPRCAQERAARRREIAHEDAAASEHQADVCAGERIVIENPIALLPAADAHGLPLRTQVEVRSETLAADDEDARNRAGALDGSEGQLRRLCGEDRLFVSNFPGARSDEHPVTRKNRARLTWKDAHGVHCHNAIAFGSNEEPLVFWLESDMFRLEPDDDHVTRRVRAEHERALDWNVLIAEDEDERHRELEYHRQPREQRVVRFEYDIGDRITGKRGTYRIRERLGAGGMGACYLVEDTDAPHFYVLKTMQARLASKKDARDAFELEARGLIALHKCPNIVHAFLLDATSTGVPFYLMEHLSGLSLREILKRKKRPHLDAIIGIGVGLASALEYAHGKEIVHCDVKPDNIFIVHRAEGPLVKLLDFGVMKLNLVRAGYEGAAGTPAYMAPEQLRGESVDARSDLFAAGLVLYEMLAGKHAFADFGMDEKGAMARIDAVPAPINQVARELPWQIANIFDDLIGKLLEPKRERRYKDASAIIVKLHDVKRALDRMKKGDVHAATTNPAGPPQDLIAQITGVIDDEAIAGETDPNLDLSSEPELVAAVAKSAEDSTHPPSRALPEPDRKNVSYIEPQANSYERAAKAAKLLPDESPKPATPKPTGGLDLTSGEREYVDNLAKHVKDRAEGGFALAGRPRPPAPETVLEDDDYHRRLRRKDGEIHLSSTIVVAIMLGVVVMIGAAAYLLVHP